MRTIYTISFLVLFNFFSAAQGKSDTDEDGLLPTKAFDKMIIEDITYAIFGESTPVSGIKVDVSKPEATISGVFQPKKKPSLLFGFDFKGGITDKNFVILKGDNIGNFNTVFELKPSLHIIPAWNSAKYYTREKPILVHKNDLIEKETQKLVDSFYVVALIYNKHLTNFPDLLDDDDAIPQTLDAEQKKTLIHFIKKSLKDDALILNSSQTEDELLDVIQPAKVDDMDNTYKDNIRNMYKKYKKLYDKRLDDESKKQIANVSSAWTQKKSWWFTVSPFGRTEKINEYHTKYEEVDSLYFKSNHHFYYGLNAMVNRYRIWPNKVALFWRLGIGLSHSNNLSTLSSFNYETITSFFGYGNSVTTKNKSGTAYNYDDIKAGFTKQLTAEIYILPIASYFFPGVYFSGSVNSSELYKLPKIVDRGDDKIQIPVEGGFIFNINSREKDKEKSILSISFYCRHEDLTDKRRITIADGIQETRDEFLKRNLSFGVKVGIPITLPQRERL